MNAIRGSASSSRCRREPSRIAMSSRIPSSVRPGAKKAPATCGPAVLVVAHGLTVQADRDRNMHADGEAALALRSVRYGDDEHYDIISAFIKSIRGSDPDAGLYWLARLLEAGEAARFIARRLVGLRSE